MFRTPLPCPVMALRLFPIPLRPANIFLPVPSAKTAATTILPPMRNGAGTATGKTGISAIPSTCSLTEMICLMFKFTEACRHDSLNFLYTIDDFGRHSFGLTPKNICLDSAHDNIPTYKLLEHWDINAFIDINGRIKTSENAPDNIRFNREEPLCSRRDIKYAPRAMIRSKRSVNTTSR